MPAPTVRLTPDGYVVSCDTPAGIEGHGPTESAAWDDFRKALRTGWHPSGAAGDEGLDEPSSPPSPRHVWRAAANRLRP